MDETQDHNFHLAILNSESTPCTLPKGKFWLHGMDEQSHCMGHPIMEILQGIATECSPCMAIEVPDVDGTAVFNRVEQKNRAAIVVCQSGLKRDDS